MEREAAILELSKFPKTSHQQPVTINKSGTAALAIIHNASSSLYYCELCVQSNVHTKAHEENGKLMKFF